MPSNKEEVKMPVDNAALMTGATGATITGGSALTFTEDGVEIKNGKHVAAATISDFRLRPNISVRTRQSVQQSDGTWSKEKRWMTYVQPRLLDTGEYGYELVRIEVENYPDASPAEKLELYMMGAQLLTDDDFASFRSTGSVA